MDTQYTENQASNQPGQPTLPNTNTPDVSNNEARIAELLAADDQDAAANLFLEMIEACTRSRDFATAEALHARMYDETPMALTAIIQAGELIEAQKEAAIDHVHLKRWDSLYANLNQEETTTFSFALQEVTCVAGEKIFQQGAVDGRLFLVETGRLKMVCHNPETGEEVTIQEVQAGEIFGADHFFAFSVCTYSAVAVSDCKLKCLAKHYLFTWQEDMPAFADKIRTYCQTLEKASDIIVRQGIERRTDTLRSSNVRATLETIATAGLPHDWSRSVRFSEVSPGGACLEIKLNNTQDAETLLGETLKLGFTLQVAGKARSARLTARVAAIEFMAFGECCMHVQFTKRLSDKVLGLF